KQRITDSRAIYRWIESSGNIRAKLSKIFYGDQAIFVRRDIFFKIGGFDEVALFDDVLFSKKLRREGQTRVLNRNVYTLPRRWKRQGIIKVTLINCIVNIGFKLGVSPQRLKKFYCEIR
ncbi:MAG: glycosyl transferase family 2, partial [Omnitrophica bacterium]|nr:glycosyl transferase family 2 [Candidatus Omnitrophota bacterium]